MKEPSGEPRKFRSQDSHCEGMLPLWKGKLSPEKRESLDSDQDRYQPTDIALSTKCTSWNGMPIIAPFVSDRRAARIVTAIVALLLLLTASGLPVWRCPVHALFGVPCPGCGLTRSILCLLKGDWRESLSYHPFGILFFIAGALVSLAAFLPEKWGKAMGRVIEKVEMQTGLTMIALLSALLFGVLRLLFSI